MSDIALASPQQTTLADYLGVFRRWLWFIIAFAIVFTGVSAAIIFNLRPLFTATAIISAEAPGSKVVDVQSVGNEAPASPAVRTQLEVIRSETEIIQSPQIIAAVVKDQHLTENPKFMQMLGERNYFSLSFLLSLLPSSVTDLLPGQGGTTPIPVDVQATNAILKRIAVVNDGKSYVIKLHVTTPDAQLSTTIANGIAEAYLDQQRQSRVKAVDQANQWLDRYLEQLRTSVVASDRAVEQFRKTHKLTPAKDGMTVDTQQLAELNAALALASADRAQKEAELQAWHSATQNPEQGMGVVESPLLQRLSEQRAALLRRQAELLTQFGERYPAVVQVRAEVADLDRTIQKETGRVIENATKDVRAARVKEDDLHRKVQAAQQAAAVNDQALVQLRALQRDDDANRTLYNNLLQRAKEAAVEKNTQEPWSRIVSAATVPVLPSFPNKTVMTGGAGVAGLLIGVLLGFFLDWTRDGFRSADEVTKATGLPTLGLVPRMSTRRPPEDEVLNSPTSLYSECIHSVAALMRVADGHNSLQTVLVTSSVPGEGKTSFAVSLARAVATAGRRCLLVDCDFRCSRMADTLGAGQAALAVREWTFARPQDLEARLVRDPSGSDVLVSRADDAQPHTLLASGRLDEFLDHARQRYDFIVIDAPPVLAVSDALHLSQLSDQIVFVVRWGTTPRKVVQNAMTMLRQRSCRIAGVVITQVNLRQQAKYRHGDVAQYARTFSKYYRSERTRARA
ncbi:MAG TPA: polysaccharide biosynthesis tyrosine autokinase [Stellaceae bacterium]|nr:polysaccharide biosynthesis tyrosine autokinase [Stellaceae bacterium]